MQRKKLFLFLFFISLFFALLSFIKTFRDVQKFGGMDLREKIVGARLLSAGLSPYYYKWKNGDDEKFLDPLDGYNVKITRVATPPGMMLFFVPLSKLNYQTAKWIWFSFSYLCFLLLVFLFWNLSSEENKFYVGIIAMIFFLCSLAWQMHIERGQVYIFYALLLSFIYWFCSNKKFFLAGIFIALLCWLRLPFLIFVPFILFFTERKKIIYGFVSSAIFLLAISFLFTSGENWRDYFSSVQEWSKFELHEMTCIPDAVKPNFPAVIEGQTNLADARDFLQNNRAVQCYALWFFNLKLHTPQLMSLFFIAALIFGGIIFLKWKKKEIFFDQGKIFLSAFLLYILAEYFMPAPSYSYHYMQWIFPVFIMVSSKRFELNISSALIFLGLAMNIGAMSFVPYNLFIGECILFCGVYLRILKS